MKRRKVRGLGWEDSSSDSDYESVSTYYQLLVHVTSLAHNYFGKPTFFTHYHKQLASDRKA